MSFRYEFVGDYPRSMPEYALDVVNPGDRVEVAMEINHPDFKPVVESKKPARQAEKTEVAEGSK